MMPPLVIEEQPEHQQKGDEPLDKFHAVGPNGANPLYPFLMRDAARRNAGNPLGERPAVGVDAGQPRRRAMAAVFFHLRVMRRAKAAQIVEPVRRRRRRRPRPGFDVVDDRRLAPAARDLATPAVAFQRRRSQRFPNAASSNSRALPCASAPSAPIRIPEAVSLLIARPSQPCAAHWDNGRSFASTAIKHSAAGGPNVAGKSAARPASNKQRNSRPA
jgi:hypothetical protein